MSSKVDEVKRRMKRRREQRSREIKQWRLDNNYTLLDDEERYGFEKISSYDNFNDEENFHYEKERSFFSKERFLFKLLLSACLFLIVSIMFNNENASFDRGRALVEKSFTDNFQFAVVADWYETKFGKPLAILPVKTTEVTTGNKVNDADIIDYAIPASGTVIESFQKNGQGVMVETKIGTEVETINEGIVRFAGLDEVHGKTVIVQHANKTETWYGNLDDINVNLFDFVKKGQMIGTVSKTNDEMKGSFYFAIKEGGTFINPVQVIQFE